MAGGARGALPATEEKELSLAEATASEVWPGCLVCFLATGERRTIDTGSGARRDHPWVQEQLAAIPRFEPALMFRHASPRRPGLRPLLLPALAGGYARGCEDQERKESRAGEGSQGGETRVGGSSGGEGGAAGTDGERRRLPSVLDLLEGSSW